MPSATAGELIGSRSSMGGNGCGAAGGRFRGLLRTALDCVAAEAPAVDVLLPLLFDTAIAVCCFDFDSPLAASFRLRFSSSAFGTSDGFIF